MFKMHTSPYIFAFVAFTFSTYCHAQQDGTLDASFGTNGIVIEDVALQSYPDRSTCISVQSDDKILLGGYSYNSNFNRTEFAIIRFNPDGSIDTSFGTNGITYTSLGGNNYANSLEIQSDGKILLAGYSETFGFRMSVARYNTDGFLDTTFNTSGMLDVDGYLEDIIIDSIGSIFLVGFGGGVIIGTTSDILLKKYNSFGIIDSSFGINGVVFDDLGGAETIHAGVIQADGKLLIAGRRSPFPKGLVARYNTDGTIDSTFNGIGYSLVDFGGSLDVILSISSLPNGQIIVAGDSYNGSGTNMAIARLHQNGIVDSTFGINGIVVEDLGGIDIGHAIYVQPDNKFVVAGQGASSSDFVAARYLSDGSPDSTFGFNGKAIIDLGGNDFGRSMAVQSNGKIIVGGYTDVVNGTYDDFAMIRLSNTLTSNSDVTLSTFNIFPNPTNDILMWNSNVDILGIEILNLLGNIVFTEINPSNNTINIGQLPSGVYQTKFFTSRCSFVKKIIKF